MERYEKELIQIQLATEEKTIAELKQIYKQAIADIDEKIKLLQWDQQSQSKIYQIAYQKQLKQQLETILNYMGEKQYTTIQEHLNGCYETSYLGAMYAIQEQGVPLILPIDQTELVRAVKLDSKLSKGLYAALGVDVQHLKKKVASEMSRGISTAMPYADIARNINNVTGSGFSNALRIVRTEGHRIQQAASFDCAKTARARGAVVVKEWCAALDAKTRPTHARLDGQIREVDEPFEAGGLKAMYPGDFGDPAEDCNCRCTLLTRSKWELDEEETRYIGSAEKMTDTQLKPIADKLHISTEELKKYSNQIIPVKAKSYDDFVRQYNIIWNYTNQGGEK